MKVNGDSPVTLTNYEEWLVLYLDNELTPGQKTTVDKFLAINTVAQEEFTLLHRTKLQPEKIIFADKASLYRKEDKVKPIPVRWWRLAAAAILLLAAGITTVVLVNKKSPGDEEIVKGSSTEKKNNAEVPVVIPKESNNMVNESIVADNNKESFIPAIKQIDNNNAVTKEKNSMVKNPLPVEIINPNPLKQETVVVNNKPTNDLPQPIYNPNIIKSDANNKAIASDNTLKEIRQQDVLTNTVVTTQNPKSSDIVNASFTNTDDAAIDQPNDKKNKSRGFFRKVARTFEKRTNIDPTDDNKLLVAGLAIKLK